MVRNHCNKTSDMSRFAFSSPAIQKKLSNSDEENDDDRKKMVSLTKSLIMQINHLGGIDNSNWRVLKSTFESFYDELDTTTHRRLYNKYQYWKGDPSKYNSFCDIQRLSLCSPEIVTTSAPNIVSSVVQNMTDLQQYAPMLPPGFDLNRIGTLKNTFPL